eukprot:TRINITY_DN18958_c0_g1_i1.p1 TRINITY_DN18958_c0_g1~~TRINITY_DN18958_c0_g1_i1.p1  ORF type:complete len:274 (-),score=58.04 TRINITY_DN18958_c0_g1_i1:2-823(-)
MFLEDLDRDVLLYLFRFLDLKEILKVEGLSKKLEGMVANYFECFCIKYKHPVISPNTYKQVALSKHYLIYICFVSNGQSTINAEMLHTYLLEINGITAKLVNLHDFEMIDWNHPYLLLLLTFDVEDLDPFEKALAFYGWLVDNEKINLVPNPPPFQNITFAIYSNNHNSTIFQLKKSLVANKSKPFEQSSKYLLFEHTSTYEEWVLSISNSLKNCGQFNHTDTPQRLPLTNTKRPRTRNLKNPMMQIFTQIFTIFVLMIALLVILYVYFNFKI